MAAAAVALASCTIEQEIKIEEPKGVSFEITADTNDTKTANDGVHTTWVAGDQINLFHAEKDTDSYVSDGAFTASADGSSVKFSGTLGAELDAEKQYDWYALYPYEDDYANSPAKFDYVHIAKDDGTQLQTGNDSRAHLAGAGYPLWGRKLGIAAATKPAITLKQMTAVIAVNVTNKIEDAVTVSRVEFWSSSEDYLVGEYRTDFSDSSPVFSPSAGFPIATLNVAGASPLAKDGSAVYYFAVKPFTAPAGSTLSIRITTDEGVQTSENVVPANFTFAAGKIYTLNFGFTNKTVNLAQFPYNDPAWLTAQGINPGSESDKNLEGVAQTVNPISITSTDGGTKTRIHKTSGEPDTYDLRVYKNGGSLAVAPTSDTFVIEKIAFTGTNLSAARLSANCGSYSGDTKTWTGLTQEVVFTAADTWNVQTIGVFYREATASDHILIVPVTEFDVPYAAGSVNLDIKQLNISDLAVSSTSPGFDGYSVAGNTVTVNFSANTSSDPRNIVVSVSSASAGVNETVTITQAGAPASVSSLSYNTLGTVTAQIAAFSTKGFILADNTGAILMYTNADNSSTYSIGQTMTVSGTVGHYNTGLQFPTASTIEAGAAGSFDYPTPATYTATEIAAWNADGNDRFASYITLSGVIKKNGSNYDIIVGGGSTANVTLYYPLSTFTSGLAEGDNVTVTGYAISVMSSRCAVIPTSVVNSETTPKIIYSDITGVTAAEVTGAQVSGSAVRISGWTPNVTYTGCVTAASINATCTKITYSVGENTESTEKTGTIVVTFTKSGESDVQYTINVTQEGKATGIDITVNIGEYALSHSWANSSQYTSMTIDSNVTVTVTGGGNSGKYYTSGNEWRLYQTESPTITIGAGTHTIFSVTVTYNVSNTGVLKDASSNNVTSGSSYAVNASSVTFSVGNTGSATKGQVKITGIRVIYN